ncbi:MAG: ABC transporter permease [Planctomycetes bacterium]|nr:ABC transporter permease [Planctomycetota bacterium]
MIHDWLKERSGRGAEVSGWRRSWPLAQAEFLTLFRSRWGVALFLLCLFPGLGRLVMLLIIFGVVNFGPVGLRARLQNRAEIPGLDPSRVDFYLEPVVSVMPGMVFFLLLTSLVVARTIARDRLANAMELYWTRGLSPLAYVACKWLGGWLVVASITVMVPLALWLTAGFLAEDWSLLATSAGGMARAAVGLVVVSAAWTGICLALSAICGSPNAAMVAWSMLLVGSSAVGVVLASALREPWLRSCLSLWEAGTVVVRAIAGVPQRGVSIPGACAMLAGCLIVTMLLARSRLRLEEALR